MHGLNPFWVAVAVALVVLVATTLISRRNEAQLLTATIEHGATTGPRVAATLAVVFALAVVLVPIGIAIAGLWGPTAGIVAYFAVLVGGLVKFAVSRRSGG